MDETNETDKAREQTAKEPENASHLPDKLVAQRREVAEKVARDMEELGSGWKIPWTQAGAPMNPATGTEYRGGNAVYLKAYAAIRGYGDYRWATYNQGKERGWKLKKGSKAVSVEHWRSVAVERKDAQGNAIVGKDGEPERGSRVVLDGYWNVFNLSCFEGAPELPPFEPNDDADFGLLADELKASCRCPVEETTSPDAFYSPVTDKVTVPRRGQFESNAAFCGTLLHEMAHATAPELGRDVVNLFGSEAYAREELTAELASLFASGKQAPGRADAREARTAYEADRAEKERLGDKKTAIEKQKEGARSERAERLKRSAERKRQRQASTGSSRRGPSSRDADQSRGRSR